MILKFDDSLQTTLLPPKGSDFQLWDHFVATRNNGPFAIFNNNRRITLGEEWIHAPSLTNK